MVPSRGMTSKMTAVDFSDMLRARCSPSRLTLRRPIVCTAVPGMLRGSVIHRSRMKRNSTLSLARTSPTFSLATATSTIPRVRAEQDTATLSEIATRKA